MRSENQQEILSQLREIYDGQYSKAFGNGKRLDWRGRVGLIAACTPVFDKHHTVLSSLGDRFLLYRSHTENQKEMGVRAQKFVGQERQMRKEIQETFHRFLDQFTDLEAIQFDQDEWVNKKIISLACFCAAGRCAVDRNRYDQTLEYIPIPEGTPRLVKQFMQVGMGIALAQGKTVVDEAVYRILKKIGGDLLPAKRLLVLRYLWKGRVFEHREAWKKTREIADAVDIPTSSARLILEDLQIVGLLNRLAMTNEELESNKTIPYKWQINSACAEYLFDAEVFTSGGSDRKTHDPTSQDQTFQDGFDGVNQ